MIDLDGSYSYSKIVNVSKQINDSFVTVQNPAVDGAFIVRTNASIKNIKVVNMTGMPVQFETQIIGSNEYRIIISRPVSGMYLVMIPDSNQKINKVLVP